MRTILYSLSAEASRRWILLNSLDNSGWEGRRRRTVEPLIVTHTPKGSWIVEDAVYEPKIRNTPSIAISLEKYSLIYQGHIHLRFFQKVGNERLDLYRVNASSAESSN